MLILYCATVAEETFWFRVALDDTRRFLCDEMENISKFFPEKDYTGAIEKKGRNLLKNDEQRERTPPLSNDGIKGSAEPIWVENDVKLGLNGILKRTNASSQAQPEILLHLPLEFDWKHLRATDSRNGVDSPICSQSVPLICSCSTDFFTPTDQFL